MKQIIKISDKCGTELRTRIMMEQLADSFEADNQYLLDMNGVSSISRSAADELYNIIHDRQNVEMINLSPFVQKMFDAVVLSRFQPRQLRKGQTPIIYCQDADSFKNELMKIQNFNSAI